MSLLRELTQLKSSPILPWKLLFELIFKLLHCEGQALKTTEENRMCCWRWRENLNTSYIRVNAVKTAVPKSWLLPLSGRLRETACHCSCSTQSRNIPAWLSLPVYWRLQRVPKCNWTDAPTSLGALRQHQRFALAYCMFPSTSMHLLERFNTPSIRRIENVRNKSIMLKSSQNSRSNHTGQEMTELSLPGNPDVFPWC